MSLYLHVAQPSDIDEILEFESEQMKLQISDESERMIQSWSARWRKEALEHYLQYGWSFLARETDLKTTKSPQGELQGLFLGQGLLFFDGHTQSLWIEHMSYRSLVVRDQLCELAYKLGREKNLQNVYFPHTEAILNVVKVWNSTPWTPGTLKVKTTKS